MDYTLFWKGRKSTTLSWGRPKFLGTPASLDLIRIVPHHSGLGQKSVGPGAANGKQRRKND